MGRATVKNVSMYIKQQPDKIDRLIRKVRPFIFFTALNTVRRKIDKNSDSLLDVGCGTGEPIISMNNNMRLTVGLDAFYPYLIESMKLNIYDSLVEGDVRYLPFADRSFDTVICLEVLEHLDRHEGEKLLNELERVANKQVIFSTPIGVFGQSDLDGNPYQVHRHLWSLQDIALRGYDIVGLGIKGLFREKIDSRWLRLLREILYVFGGLLSYKFPKIGCHTVCIKNIDRAMLYEHIIQDHTCPK